jgi:2,3-bisphosphoglycerate-dependent phosphoglycerate mutase
MLVELTADDARHMDFYFLRHGETETNVHGVLAGSTDVDLTENGRDQARYSTPLLAGRGIAKIYASPLRRALETADIVAAPLGLGVIVTEAFRERNWGELEGGAMPKDLEVPHIPGGEPLAAFEQRVLNGLRQCFEDSAHRPFLVVAHAGTFRAICAIFKILLTGWSVANATPVGFTDTKPNGHCAA